MDGSNCFGVVMFKCDIFLLKPLIKDAINVVVEIQYPFTQTPVEYTLNI